MTAFVFGIPDTSGAREINESFGLMVNYVWELLGVRGYDFFCKK
jgi:hypothetical protein